MSPVSTLLAQFESHKRVCKKSLKLYFPELLEGESHNKHLLLPISLTLVTSGTGLLALVISGTGRLALVTSDIGRLARSFTFGDLGYGSFSFGDI